jgi:ribulose-phosphate 3-epimerase
MNKKILIAPSILSADFTRLREELKKIEDSGGNMVHIDVMDGHFVPNITIGPLIVEAIRRSTSLPLDVHLMIEKPHNFIKEFAEAGSDIITIHAEAYPLGETREQRTPYHKGTGQAENRKGTSKTANKIDETKVKQVLAEIKSLGKKAGISINPDSPVSSIKNILKDVDMILIMSVHPGFGGQKFIKAALPKIKEARKLYKADIEVDGGINDKNVKSVIDAGANVIVAGFYFFSAKDQIEAIRKLKLS